MARARAHHGRRVSLRACRGAAAAHQPQPQGPHIVSAALGGRVRVRPGDEGDWCRVGVCRGVLLALRLLALVSTRCLPHTQCRDHRHLLQGTRRLTLALVLGGAPNARPRGVGAGCLQAADGRGAEGVAGRGRERAPPAAARAQNDGRAATAPDAAAAARSGWTTWASTRVSRSTWRPGGPRTRATCASGCLRRVTG